MGNTMTSFAFVQKMKNKHWVGDAAEMSEILQVSQIDNKEANVD